MMAIDPSLGSSSRTPDPVLSIATPLKDPGALMTAKGLLNRPGQNNCFLNSAIQVLWHLDVFRRSFRDLTGHACLAESCMFCALKELFSELQHSPAKALPPDTLRKALADSFLDQQRFQIGFMDDAAECFENMLLRIHEHIAHREPEDRCAAPHCVPHQKFAMTLVEQSICANCGANTEPLTFTQMVQYVSTSTLVHQLRVSVGQTGRPDSFGRLLQRASSMGDTRQCPASCGSVTQMRRILTNHPEIVSIGLVWNSDKPSIEHISEVFSSIDTTLKVNQVFNTVTDTRWAETTTHNLVGVVTYYGKHYSTFFFHTKLMEWIFLDDATVRDVGPRWEHVVEKCKKGKFQPLLLLYATPNGTPINLDYAPKLNTPFYTNKKPPLTNQQLLRRSVTPSPEKPIIGTTRRAITPNPENSALQKPPLPKHYNEYQNLSIIQKNIGCDEVDGCLVQKQPEYVTRKALLEGGKPVHRTLSNGSSSGVESGVCINDHINLPRRRDSGNWSGDRNSASSASSTTMENPYLYLVGKLPPGSPTRTKGEGGIGIYDAGYDSYSISSNDSNNMTTLQHLMKTGHLAQIPEDYGHVILNQSSHSCDVLCDEADELLVKSRQLEDAHDLVLALALCNAAATKARAAMNAPYNNPQTLTLARMKHNTCIMRARSLHRRMTQIQNQNKENSVPEIRHTREGSSGSARHSRQNSRDKGQHSRQNSRELLVPKEKARPTKSIEIYATLPKKKDVLKAKMNAINIEDEEYMLYSTKAPERESRSIFSRSKNKDTVKIKEKRSRSEDRSKISIGDFSIAPEIKDTLKKAKESKEKDEAKKDKDGKNKKQHKIRRKLLMGGLIRRKNRSMPDLTDSNAESPPLETVDDTTTVGTIQQGMNGYLSEGHLEFAGTTANPNLERSKLMRKSFHGSAGKILTAAKVPPPPPLRTTSQLSRSKSNVSSEVAEKLGDKSHQFNIYGDVNIYHNLAPFNQQLDDEQASSMSLPYYGNSNSSYDDSFGTVSSHTVVTQADVHHEQNPDSGVDEVDCLPSHRSVMLDLPPYPSPGGSAIHSRQASEEFPPPPPPLDLSALEEHLPKVETLQEQPNSDSLLAQLQHKRQEILSQETAAMKVPQSLRSSGDTWLKELQAKQAALRSKRNETENSDVGRDDVNSQRCMPVEAKVKSVRDLASKFENGDIAKPSNKPLLETNKQPVPFKSTAEFPAIAPEQIAEEIREVEMITSAVNKVFGGQSEDNPRPKPQKKKSVSFCDQVTLVATAEEREEDTYIPNPILERVLRSAVTNPETLALRQEIISLREKITQSPVNSVSDNSYLQQPRPVNGETIEPPPTSYVRRNSVDSLLNQSTSTTNGDFSSVPQPHQLQYYQNSNNIPPHVEYYSGNSNNSNSTPSLGQYSPGYEQFAISGVQYSPVYGSPHQQVSRPPSLEQNSSQSQHHQAKQHTYGFHPYYAEKIPQTTYTYVSVEQQQARQTPYQPIPQNAPAHPGYHGSSRQMMQPKYYTANGQVPSNYGYAPSPRPLISGVRQSTPSPSSVHPVNSTSNYSPSPVPSVSSCNNYYPQQTVYRNSPNVSGQAVYQRVPPPGGEYPPHYPDQQLYQKQDVYQRVPAPHGEEHLPGNRPVYQRVPSPKHPLLKKSVSFEPGTKGCESPIPKPVVMPIVVNNAHTTVPTDKTKCSLCRKKNVVTLNVYCKDCEFYMSRFKPKS